MTSPDLPPDVDTRLRVVLADKTGVAYLTGNSHTSRGRMSAFHEAGYDITISKGDIAEASEAAAVWVDGFLAGSEPPFPDDGDDEAAEAVWYVEREQYRRTGIDPNKD